MAKKEEPTPEEIAGSVIGAFEQLFDAVSLGPVVSASSHIAAMKTMFDQNRPTIRDDLTRQAARGRIEMFEFPEKETEEKPKPKPKPKRKPK